MTKNKIRFRHFMNPWCFFWQFWPIFHFLVENRLLLVFAYNLLKTGDTIKKKRKQVTSEKSVSSLALEGPFLGLKNLQRLEVRISCCTGVPGLLALWAAWNYVYKAICVCWGGVRER